MAKFMQNGLRKVGGIYKVSNNTIRVITNSDICRYYRWLFNKAHYNTIKNQIPKHGGHVSIILPTIHKGLDLSDFKCLNNKTVEFEVDVRGNYGGFRRGFLNFWLDVYCEEFILIRKELGVYKEEKGFCPFHLTILNTK